MIAQTDIVISGGGPGAQIVLIEENKIGGVRLNVGCIPTKALLWRTEVYRAFQRAEESGLKLEGSLASDWPA